MQYIICITGTGFVQYQVQCIEQRVKQTLEDHGIEDSGILDDLFHNVQQFLGLETEYHQTSYFVNGIVGKACLKK